MKWEVNNNTIEKLWVDGRNIIFPWGLETADSSAFFSLEEGVGYRHTILENESSHTETSFSSRMVVQMAEGKWELVVEDAILSQNRVSRKATLTCLEDCHFMDFVMRFRFRKDLFPQSSIAGKRFDHTNSNIYRQYPVLSASLHGKMEVQVSVVAHHAPFPLRPWMYVRDRGEEWIIHARQIPELWDKVVIKLCNSWAKTRPLPRWLSDPLLVLSCVRKSLWYRPERFPYTDPILKRINPSAIPIAKIPKGEKLHWHVHMELS